MFVQWLPTALVCINMQEGERGDMQSCMPAGQQQYSCIMELSALTAACDALAAEPFQATNK